METPRDRPGDADQHTADRAKDDPPLAHLHAAKSGVTPKTTPPLHTCMRRRAAYHQRRPPPCMPACGEERRNTKDDPPLCIPACGEERRTTNTTKKKETKDPPSMTQAKFAKSAVCYDADGTSVMRAQKTRTWRQQARVGVLHEGKKERTRIHSCCTHHHKRILEDIEI